MRQLREEALIQLHSKARQTWRLARLAAPGIRVRHLCCAACWRTLLLRPGTVTCSKTAYCYKELKLCLELYMHDQTTALGGGETS